MIIEIEIINKARAHQIYHLADGTRVPGVTTVLGLLTKPALVPWANKLGLQGIEVGKYVDILADVGTLTHHRIECEFTGAKPDMSEYSARDIEMSDNSMLSYYDWAKGHKIEPITNELQLVSEIFRYGGTCDIVCVLDNKIVLLDLKTGKAIYDDMLIQLAAYRGLLAENNHHIERAIILNIPRSEDERFDIREVDRSEYWDIFLNLLNIYNLKKSAGMR